MLISESFYELIWDAFSDSMVTEFELDNTDETIEKMEKVLKITLGAIAEIIGN